MTSWPHLMIDRREVDPVVLADAGHLDAFLREMPRRIGMTPITPVKVSWTPLGLTGYVIIAESHICAHTNVEARAVNVDVFSCREFAEEEVVRLVAEWWPGEYGTHRLLERAGSGGA